MLELLFVLVLCTLSVLVLCLPHFLGWLLRGKRRIHLGTTNATVEVDYDRIYLDIEEGKLSLGLVHPVVTLGKSTVAIELV